MINFKIAIFDLDYTLWDGKKLYQGVISILDNLYKQGITMYIASHNNNANTVCKKLSIAKYFKCIYGSKTTPKNNMITNILNINDSIKYKDFIFFDDSFENVVLIEGMGIRSIQINPLFGITWDNVPKSTGSEFTFNDNRIIDTYQCGYIRL